MASLYELFVRISGDNSGFKKSIKESHDDLFKFGHFAEEIGKKLAGALAFGAIAEGILKAGEAFEKAEIKIQRATGSSGHALEGFNESFKKLYAGSSASADVVAGAMAKITQKTGAFGKELEGLTAAELRFAKVTGSDVTAAVTTNERVFSAWNVTVKQQGAALDVMYVATQKTGISAEQLSQSLITAGPALRNLGFGFKEAVALIGSFEKAGLNADEMVMGLNVVFTKFVAANKDPKQALTELTEKMGSAATRADALNLAIGAGFNVRTAGKFVDAVRSGAFHLSDLIKMLEGSSGAVSEMAKKTETLEGAWTKFTHQLQITAAPAGQGILGFTTKALQGWALIFHDLGEKFSGIEDLINKHPIAAMALGLALNPNQGVRGGEGGAGESNFVWNPKTGGFDEQKGPLKAPVGDVGESGGGKGAPSKTDYETAKIQIDAALAHSKALLDIKRSQYEEEERLGKISVANNFKRLKELEEQELRLTLAALDRKLALSKEKNEGKVDASLLASKQAALDHSAAQEIRLQQHVTAEEEKQFDERVKYHVHGENAKLQATEKALDERIKYHVQGLNAELKFDQNVAEHVRELNERMADDRVRAESMGVAGEMEHQTRVLELRRQQVDFEEQIGLISAKEKLRILNSVDAEEEELQRKAIQRQIELLEARSGIDTDYASKKQALENRLQDLEDRHRARERKNLNDSMSDFSRWVTRLRGSVGTIENAMKTLGQTARQAFDQFAQGMGQNITHAVIYSESVGKAMKAALAATLESLSAQSFAYAIFAGAVALLDFATGNFAGAAAAAQAAALFGAVGIVTAVMARALTPKQDKQQGVSSAGGLGEVPYDGYQATLHKKETVLPADIAIPMRAQLRNGGLGGGGVQIHIANMSGVTKETVNLFAGQMVRQLRLSGVKV